MGHPSMGSTRPITPATRWGTHPDNMGMAPPPNRARNQIKRAKQTVPCCKAESRCKALEQTMPSCNAESRCKTREQTMPSHVPSVTKQTMPSCCATSHSKTRAKETPQRARQQTIPSRQRGLHHTMPSC